MYEADPEGAAAYGDNCAEFYDQIYSTADSRLIDTLVRLANGGPVLELGVGTGRVALPLRARGIDVTGIEASQAMLTQLGRKQGADGLNVIRGNFADFDIQGPYRLIFALVSTFYLLRSAEEQQRCFHSVARVLDLNGVLLLENYEPAGEILGAGNIHLFKEQISTRAGPREYRSRICYASPSSLDEMAAIAGLKLRERWGDWSRRPFSSRDALHISLYELK